MGILGDHYKDAAFGWNRSGLFMYCHVFPENDRVYKNPWQPNPDVPAGAWLEYELNIYLVTEFFWFMSRLAHELPSQNITYQLDATGLRDRRLATMNAHIGFSPSEPCKAMKYLHRKTVPTDSLRVEWEQACAEALVNLLRLFVTDWSIDSNTMLKWIDKLKGVQA
jgi:hypothetical protein